jgi:hypothetical protein
MKKCTEMNNSVGQAGVHTVLFMWLMNLLSFISSDFFLEDNSNLLLKLEDGITPIEITEFVRTVIKMNLVMNFTIF